MSRCCWLTLLGLLAAGCIRVPPEGNPRASREVPRNEPWWVARHEKLVEKARTGQIDLLFLGDSITQGWHGRGRDRYEGNGLDVWEQYYGSRMAENFGMGSDRTQNLLWRIRHGELSGIHPRVVVLLIGTNNLDEGVEQTARGVEAVVDELLRQLPGTRVLLLGILPRGVSFVKERAFDQPDPRVMEANRLIARIDAKPRVVYLDVGEQMLEPDGRLSRRVFPDFMHLSREGYERLAEAMEPTLSLMLGE